MTISELFSRIEGARVSYRSSAAGDLDAASICFDSRKLEPGCIFVAVRGSARDGHAFVGAAVAVGAAGLVVEDESAVPGDFDGAIAIVPDARAALGRLAALFFGEPSLELFAIGVTGTNGKTTTTHMIEAVLTERGWPTGVIGTIDHHLGARVWPTELTTPDPVEFQKRLREFASAGAKAVALEASSHALSQRRVDDVAFDCAVFTNLTRDHLDYHKDMDEYFEAKARLFFELLARSTKPARRAIVNVDDAYGRALYDRLRSRAPTWSFGAAADADLRFEILSSGFDGATFRLAAPGGAGEFKLRMPGAHNVSNAVAAIGTGLAAGATLAQAAAALGRLAGVNGRLESIANDKGLHVFVDFAHTDSALAGVLAFLNEIRGAATGATRPRIFTVFGCGGDRDKGKRPLMMKAALAGSDFVVLTSDNPRGEDPLAIMRDALAGAPAGALGDLAAAQAATQGKPAGSGIAVAGRVFAEPDRRAAIGLALRLARPGDVILIAGKGHEAYQQIGTEKRPFSDQATAKEQLA